MEASEAYFREGAEAMAELYGRDVPMSLATADAAGRPSVRVVDMYFTEGAFYAATYGLSRKMREIALNPRVALCCGLFTAHGLAESLGHPLRPANRALRCALREAFRAFYGRHVDEADGHTCFLRIAPADATLFANGFKYEMDFERGIAGREPFASDIGQ